MSRHMERMVNVRLPVSLWERVQSLALLQRRSASAELAFLRLGRDGQGFSVQHRKPGIYRLSLATQSKPLGHSADFRPQRSFAFSASTLNKLGAQGELIKPVGPALLDELGRIIYLGELVEFDVTTKIFTSPVKKQTEDYVTGRFG